MGERIRTALEELKKIKAPSDILIRSIYTLFGRYDIMVIYEATNEHSSSEFLCELRKITGIVDTETFLAKELQRTE